MFSKISNYDDIDVRSYNPVISKHVYEIEVRTNNYNSHVNIYFRTDGVGAGCICITPEAARKLATELLARLDAKVQEPVKPAPSKDKDFFLAVINKETKEPRPAAKPKTYKTLAQAKAVALKMAEEHKGDTFAIYEKVGQAVLPVSPVRFETV